MSKNFLDCTYYKSPAIKYHIINVMWLIELREKEENMTLEAYCIENQTSKLLDEWAKENEALTPSKVLINSSAPIWWRCSCGNIWKDTVANRIAGKACERCSEEIVTNESVRRVREREQKPRCDLRGNRYGRLEVIEYKGTEKESQWLCRCDCGNEVVVMHSSLTGERTTSCGCKQDEVRRENFKKSIHFVEGTCIERIAAKTTPKNNTSGFRGVSRRGNGRFRVGITFKGKRYNLGTYGSFEEAIEARLAGEMMMDEFVEDFKQQMVQQMVQQG